MRVKTIEFRDLDDENRKPSRMCGQGLLDLLFSSPEKDGSVTKSTGSSSTGEESDHESAMGPFQIQNSPILVSPRRSLFGGKQFFRGKNMSYSDLSRCQSIESDDVLSVSDDGDLVHHESSTLSADKTDFPVGSDFEIPNYRRTLPVLTEVPSEAEQVLESFPENTLSYQQVSRNATKVHHDDEEDHSKYRALLAMQDVVRKQQETILAKTALNKQYQEKLDLATISCLKLESTSMAQWEKLEAIKAEKDSFQTEAAALKKEIESMRSTMNHVRNSQPVQEVFVRQEGDLSSWHTQKSVLGAEPNTSKPKSEKQSDDELLQDLALVRELMQKYGPCTK